MKTFREFIKEQTIEISKLHRTEGSLKDTLGTPARKKQYGNEKKVDKIKSLIKQNKKLPAISVVPISDNHRKKMKIPKEKTHLVVDGHHRLSAYELSGHKNVVVRHDKKSGWNY
jgi:hypothetical protein